MLQLILIEFLCLFYILSRRKNLLYNINSGKNNTFIPFIILSLFCVFYNSGWDYYSYHETHKYIFTNARIIEDISIWLMQYIRNYYVWRFVVWGISCFFLVKTANLLSADPKLFYPLFLMLPLIQVFYVTRNSMGHATLFFALTYIYSKGISLKNITICGAFLFAAYFMHKSMALYFAVAIAAMVLPVNLVTFVASIIAFPFLYLMVTNYASDFLNLQFLNDTTVAAGNVYLSAENTYSLTLIGKITRAIEMFPVLLFLLFPIVHKILGKVQIPKRVEFLLKYSYILIYVSFLFIGQASNFLHERFWNASLIPLSIFLSVYLPDKRESPIVRIGMYSLFISFLYTLIFRVYSWTPYINF